MDNKENIFFSRILPGITKNLVLTLGYAVRETPWYCETSNAFSTMMGERIGRNSRFFPAHNPRKHTGFNMQGAQINEIPSTSDILENI